jgi:GNAT superfamily N-acetyltransferase
MKTDKLIQDNSNNETYQYIIRKGKIQYYSSDSLPIKIFTKMYHLIIKNIFLTYPEKLEHKDLIDNEQNFKTLHYSITNEPSYKIIAYENDNILDAYLAYSLVGKNLWISEIQIEPSYQKRGVLKLLLKAFLSKIDNKKYQEVIISINSKNYKSQGVFQHIGFKMYKPNHYKIKLIDLNKWVEKS